MTDEEAEILELRYYNRNLSEELALAKAEVERYETMYLNLGAKYEKIKQRLDFLWQEYCLLQVKQED